MSSFTFCANVGILPSALYERITMKWIGKHTAKIQHLNNGSMNTKLQNLKLSHHIMIMIIIIIIIIIVVVLLLLLLLLLIIIILSWPSGQGIGLAIV
jgi:hypothetical protein